MSLSIVCSWLTKMLTKSCGDHAHDAVQLAVQTTANPRAIQQDLDLAVNASPHNAVLPAVAGDGRHLLHDLSGTLLLGRRRIDFRRPPDLELMFDSAEDLLAGLDHILPGVHLKLEEDVLHDRRLRLRLDQDVDRLVLGQDSLEADSNQLKRRLELNLRAEDGQRDEALSHAEPTVSVTVWRKRSLRSLERDARSWEQDVVVGPLG